MAETYGILNWHELPLVTAATLAQGLSSSSRTAKKLTGIRADDTVLMLAIIADRIGHIAWMISDDGKDGKNHPESIYERLIGPETKSGSGFVSAEDFRAAWAAITGTGGEDNA
jgi:hypothetical protein